MTFEDYNKKMSEYTEQLREAYRDKLNEYNKLYEELSEFQRDYMENVLEEYKNTIDCKAREHIYELLCYAVRNSQSGSSILDVETKEEADEIDNIIWEEIGNYLLDYEIYKDGECWAIDCMFGGNYVPYWDGWCE